MPVNGIQLWTIRETRFGLSSSVAVALMLREKGGKGQLPRRRTRPQRTTGASTHEGSASCSVETFVEFLYPGVWTAQFPPDWPPDMFAIAASLLQKSGAYTRVLSAWPPQITRTNRDSHRTAVQWGEHIKQVGGAWRKAVVDGQRSPQAVHKWWKRISARRDTPIMEVGKHRDLWESLLQLCAAADEACEGVGIPSSDEAGSDPFDVDANLLLLSRNGGSLCRNIHPSRARVLPKLHTPQNGLTIRSLSHNLALCPSSEIEPRWYRLPRYQGHCLNLLLVPWPETVMPAQFRAAEPPTGSLLNMPHAHAFFTYVPRGPTNGVLKRVSVLFQKATDAVGHIDGVILPELAVTEEQHRRVSQRVMREGAFLICGIAQPSTNQEQVGENYLSFDIPIGQAKWVSLMQHKHHRWKLDVGQIRQYGLGTELDPRVAWWEHVALNPRTLMFVSMRPWLTISALICEDLARQDPVAEILRSVGPNLVIALLMDAPQLASRWPARYATVLADDPGSSVLTLTSLGMATLSRPFQVQPRPRVIALWKDAQTGFPVEVELPNDRSAAVLNLTVQQKEEYSADGRSDDGATGYPVLSGIHFV